MTLTIWSKVGRFGAESFLRWFGFLCKPLITILQPDSLLDWCGPDCFLENNRPWRGALDIFLVAFLVNFLFDGWPLIEYNLFAVVRWFVGVFELIARSESSASSSLSIL